MGREEANWQKDMGIIRLMRIGTTRSCVKVKAGNGHSSTASGEAGAFRGELCTGVDGEGRVAAKEY